MPLVNPLPSDHDAETKELSRFFNETLGFLPEFGAHHAAPAGNFKSFYQPQQSGHGQ